MTKKVIATFVFLLVLFSGGINTQAQKDHFPPLETLYESRDVGFTAHSKVISVQATQKALKELAKLSKEFGGGGLEEDKDFYKYVYCFKNTGKKKIKVLLSGQKFLFSPVNYFLQDFTIELNPGEIREVRFVANGQPEFAEAFGNAAVWEVPLFGEDSGEKWLFRGIGKISFWKAPFTSYSYNEEVK